MKNKRYVIIEKMPFIKQVCFLILVAILLVAAGPVRAEQPRTFLLTVPLSGPLADLGIQARNGAELALKTWGGGFNLEVADEAADPRDDLDFSSVAVAMGYFTESRFQMDAPQFLYLRKPVLLPYLTSPEAASRGPATFFRMMPSFAEQGEYLALEMLKMKKRPRRILIVQGPALGQAELVEALTRTLAEPPQPPPPPPPAKGKRAAKPQPPIRPLDSKALVLTVSPAQAMQPGEIKELGKENPDIIVLALGLENALRLAPVLAESKWSKVAFWSGTTMGFREIGSAYASLNLNLNLCLPVISPLKSGNKEVQRFKDRYEAAWQTRPTWISALAYDSLTLAIRAVSSGESPAETLAWLIGESRHALGAYDLVPGGGGHPPLDMMPVRNETIGFLP